MNLRQIVLSTVLAVFATTVTASAQPFNPKDPRAVKRQFDSWKLEVTPKRLIGNVYYVGMSGVSSFLITTPQGHILMDTTFEECVPQIQKNIEKLGFKMQDIKFILSSHTHIDHTGGHALMKKLTGASIVSSAADARILETGGEDDFSPYLKEFMRYTPVKPDRIVADKETVTLGGVTLTARLTPGHTKGATTWILPLTEDGKQHTAMFLSSFSIVEGTKLLNNQEYPNIVEEFDKTFNVLSELNCDVYFAPHATAFGMTEKLRRLDQGATTNPFVDPEGLKRAIQSAERSYRNQLVAERRAAPTTSPAPAAQ